MSPPIAQTRSRFCAAYHGLDEPAPQRLVRGDTLDPAKGRRPIAG